MNPHSASEYVYDLPKRRTMLYITCKSLCSVYYCVLPNTMHLLLTRYYEVLRKCNIVGVNYPCKGYRVRIEGRVSSEGFNGKRQRQLYITLCSRINDFTFAVLCGSLAYVIDR